ncbi:MAG: hypothetical protein RSE56_03870, partial [Bacilli bacterium]
LEEIHDATLYTTTVGALAENVTSVTTSAATAGDLWKTKVTITVAVAAGKNAKVAVNMGEKAIEVTKEVKNTTYSFLMPRGNVTVSVTAVDPIVVGDSLVINPNDLLGEGEFSYTDCAARPTVDIGDETYQMANVMKSTWSTTAPEYGALQLKSKVGKIQNITALPKKVVSIVIDLKKNEPNSKNSNAITVEFADNVNFNDVVGVANDYQSITTIIATTPEVLSYTFTADIFDTNQFDYMRITATDGALYIGKITINFEKAAA